jgi:hypothetical protein
MGAAARMQGPQPHNWQLKISSSFSMSKVGILVTSKKILQKEKGSIQCTIRQSQTESMEQVRYRTLSFLSCFNPGVERKEKSV